MMVILLLTLTSVLWHEDFTVGTGGLSQLADYAVDISHRPGMAVLKAKPRFEGFASAWLAIDKGIVFTPDDVLKIRIRVNSNKVRIRYFYLDKDRRIYLEDERCIPHAEGWQDIEIPLRSATPFPSVNFPYLLMPDERPPMYLFIENLLPGDFEVEIDRVSVEREGER